MCTGWLAVGCVSLCAQVAQYNGANREVAILCNHQRTVSSAQKEGLEKLHDELEMFNKQKLVRFKVRGRGGEGGGGGGVTVYDSRGK